MKRQACALVAAIPCTVALMVAFSPAKAETNLATNVVVRSNSGCPSGQAVTEALWAIRPDREWPALVATLHVLEDRIQVMLGEDHHPREIPLPVDCTDRANRVALVIAVWSGELPARDTDAPTFSVAVPASIPAPAPLPTKRSAMVTEVGFSGFYSMVGGWVPGGSVELGWLRRDSWWGLRARGSYQSTRSLRVGIGESQYDRTLLGAAMVLQWDRPRFFISSDWGLVGAFTRAHGDGYSQNQSASGLNVGLAADGRVGLRLGPFRVWADLSLYRWASKETIRVDPLIAGPSSTSTLPAWDAHLGIGASMVFD